MHGRFRAFDLKRVYDEAPLAVEREQRARGPNLDLAKRLRDYRVARGLSLRQLATEIGVSAVTLWKWETGRSQPRPANLNAISDLLGAEPPTATALPLVAAEGAPTPESSNLKSLIEEAKRTIADVAGIEPGSVTITIEY